MNKWVNSLNAFPPYHIKKKITVNERKLHKRKYQLLCLYNVLAVYRYKNKLYEENKKF